MSLVFKKIESGDIFTRDFSPLVRNKENRLGLPPGWRLLRAEFQSADIKAARHKCSCLPPPRRERLKGDAML